MIFVDNRAGSADLIEPLRKLGVEVEATRLDFGDIMWEGRGESGESVLVGIEFKKLEELVGALRSERLQGFQMLGMRETFRYSYLMYEGTILYDHVGNLQKWQHSRFHKPKRVPLQGKMTINELVKRVHVLHLCGGLTPVYTVTRDDSLQTILALYRTWTDKNLDQHKSHIAAYEAPPIHPISDFRRAVKTWPHIGLKASLAVELEFAGSIHEASNASVMRWANIQITDEKGKSRRLGIKAAEDLHKFLHGKA